MMRLQNIGNIWNFSGSFHKFFEEQGVCVKFISSVSVIIIINTGCVCPHLQCLV